MLIVSRRLRQCLHLGHVATITVDEARRGLARLRVEGSRALLRTATVVTRSGQLVRPREDESTAAGDERSLACRPGEGFRLAGGIEVTVTKIRKGTVRLAVRAPTALSIRRCRVASAIDNATSSCYGQCDRKAKDPASDRGPPPIPWTGTSRDARLSHTPTDPSGLASRRRAFLCDA